jgi:hypothetical protein
MPVFDIKQGFDSGYSNTPFLYSDISLLIHITGSFPFWYQFSYFFFTVILLSNLE